MVILQLVLLNYELMATRNIIIAPCGNKSYLFKESWLREKGNKDFDVCLLFYHEQINNPAKYEEVEFFYHLKGFKYFMLYELFTKIRPEWLDQYDYFYFLDDDIDIDTLQINKLFSLSKAFRCAISCASLSKDSFCSWPIFRQQPDSFCRFVGQIEVMAPLFSSDALRLCLPSFTGNRSSWGIDSVWSKMLGYPKDRLIVFDEVVMKHTLPVGGGELYQKIKVDPHKDWDDVVTKFSARKQNYFEYGRLQRVNEKHSRMLFLMVRARGFWNKIERAWRDYDLWSRIVSKKNKIIKG